MNTNHSIPTMKSIFIFLILLVQLGCNTPKETAKTSQRSVAPIINTSKIAKLTKEQEKIMAITIRKHLQCYTESCKKRDKLKTTLNQTVFIELSDKNPSQEFLDSLSIQIDSKEKFLAAKDGVAIFNSGILVGYEDLKHKKRGYHISVFIKNHGDSTASIGLSESKSSLGGVSKIYKLEKSGTNWNIVECEVTGYN